MRHSDLRVAGHVLGLFAVAALAPFACTASGSDSAQHGPSFDDDAAAVDAVAGDTASTSDARARDAAADSASAGDASASDAAPTLDASADASTAADSAADSGSCTSTAAIVAGGATSLVAAHFTSGQWSAASSLGGSAAFPIAMATVGATFTAVAVSATDGSLRGTSYDNSWSAPSAIGSLASRDAAALALVGGTLHLVYQAKSASSTQDYKYFHGVETSGAWDSALDPVGGSGSSQSFGARGPSAASAGGKVVIAQAGSDGVVYDQTWDSSWAPAHAQTGTSVDSSAPPTLVALNGGAAELLEVYARKTDFHLMYSTRTAGAWSAPAEVYDQAGNVAYASTPVSIAPIAGGGAALAFMGGNAKPYFTLFASGSWSAPALLVASGPTVSSLPAIAAGVCGEDAIAAYVDNANGGVNVVRLANGTWSSPVAIGGATGVTYVGIATRP